MYGAEIVYSEGAKGSNGAVELALEMAAADSSYYMPYQYGNEANPQCHYDGTAPEILEELDEVAAFVAGLGTGGTLMGVGRRLQASTTRRRRSSPPSRRRASWSRASVLLLGLALAARGSEDDECECELVHGGTLRPEWAATSSVARCLRARGGRRPRGCA